VTDYSELPKAVREALSEPSAEDIAAGSVPTAQAEPLLEKLASLLETELGTADVSRRLLLAVGEAPLRYAPFFSRLARLFAKNEADVERDLTQLTDASHWTKTGLKGVSRIDVTPGQALAGASTAFVRFLPGTHFPEHRHLGFEQVFVLEGSYIDETGQRHGPGDLHEMAVGTRHEFWVATTETCIAASVLHGGLRFTRFPSRLFNPFMKR